MWWRMWRLSGWTQCNHKSWEGEESERCMEKGRQERWDRMGGQRDLKGEEDSNYHTWLWRWKKGAKGQEMWVASRSWEQPLAASQQEIGALNPTKARNCQHPGKLEVDLDFGLVKRDQKPDKSTWTCSLQNCEIINLWWFELLTVQWFAVAALEN